MADEQTPETPAPVPAPTPDPAAGFAVALKKHGDDAAAMARTVYADNEQLRRQVAELTGKVPGTGAVVLAPEQASAWKDLLARKPEELTQALADLEAATGKLAAFDREKLIGQAASLQVPVYDAEVLATLAGPDLRIEVRDGKDKAGKPIKVAEVVTVAKDDKGADVETRTPLDKHAEAHWAKFLPSLKAGAVTAAASGRANLGTPPGRTTGPRSAPVRDGDSQAGRLPNQKRSRI